VVAQRRRGAAASGLLIATSALAYDVMHFGVRTAGELERLPARIAVVLGLLLLLGVIAIGLRLAIRYGSPPTAWWIASCPCCIRCPPGLPGSLL
jgi:hypothetical protein